MKKIKGKLGGVVVFFDYCALSSKDYKLKMSWIGIITYGRSEFSLSFVFITKCIKPGNYIED